MSRGASRALLPIHHDVNHGLRPEHPVHDAFGRLNGGDDQMLHRATAGPA